MYVFQTASHDSPDTRTKDDAMTATTYLAKILDSTRKHPVAGKSVSWRVHAKNFAKNSPTRKHVSGVETFSAGWYTQGHNVSSWLPYVSGL